MNVLQIIPEFNVGGVETGTLDLARMLIAQGHKPVVISNGGEMANILESFGGRHYKLPVHRKTIFHIMRMIPKITDIIEKEKIDIMHVRSRAPALGAFFAARKKRIPFITTCHGYYSTHLFSKPMGWGKFIIVSSNVIGRHMMQDFGVPHERLVFIPRGVNLDEFRYKMPETKKKEFNIGMIGRLTPIKGHIYFIRAISKVIRQFPRIKVIIVGDAPKRKSEYKKEVLILVHRLGLSRYINFVGTKRDIPGVLSGLDLLVLSTVTEEAFGRVIIEAGACGVPVVATKVGGVVDIIEDRKNGLLVNPQDPTALSDAIVELLKNRKLAVRLAEEGRRQVEERFNLKQMFKKTIEVYQKAKDIKKILVIKISAIGDVILAIPSLKAIRHKFPNAHIAVLTNLASRQILQRCPYINEVIIFDKKQQQTKLKRIFEIARILRQGCLDIVVDLQNNRTSHLVAFLSLAPDRYGYKNGKLDFFLNHKVKNLKISLSPLEHQFRVLKMLEIDSKPGQLELWPSQEEHNRIDSFLSSEWVAEDQPLVGMNIGSSSKWLTKRWPVENFAMLCDRLAKELNIRVVLTGSEDESEQTKRLLGLTKTKPIIATGKTTLLELASLIKRCKVFVTSDSAPLHIAVSMKTPTIALFGPTDPNRHVVSQDGLFIVRKDLNCSPCYKSYCINPKCMTQITVDEIMEDIKQILGRK